MVKKQEINREFGLYRRLLRYLTPYKLEFTAALACMVFFGASDGGVPFLIKYILDGVFAQQNRDLLYLLPMLLFGFAVVRAIADFGQQFLAARIGHKIVRDIRNELNEHLLRLEPNYFVNNASADLIARMTSDVVLVRTLLTDTVAAVMRDTVRIVALLAAAVYLDPLLTGIAIFVLPIGLLPVYRFGRKTRRLSRTGQEAIGSLSAMAQESILGNRVVKIFSREPFEAARFRQENERLNDTFVKTEKVRALIGPVNEILASLAISGVILYGGYSVIQGIRSQGDFIAFLFSVFLIYDPYKKLSRMHATIQQGIAGAERIFEVLDIRPAIADPAVPRQLSKGHTIQFSRVSFAYAGETGPVLSDITLTIEEGKRVALVGFSGAGKSTLVDLIPRFIDPLQGEITIGGVDLKSVSLRDLRSRIAMVGQHTFLFNDTIFNNIAYGNSRAEMNDVVRAAKAAYAYEFISQLPNGFDTVVGEGGMTLSGGERQRIAIARAILKDAPILIFDEATASLDNRSEREVQSALDELEKGRTSIIIAHRLSTVRHADSIIVMREGRIVETGTHVELLKQKGEYAKLYSLQFRDQGEGSPLDDAVIN